MSKQRREQPPSKEYLEAVEIARAFLIYIKGPQKNIEKPPAKLVRTIEHLLRTKVIQGIYDQIGDKIINSWVNSKFGGQTAWDRRVNKMLRSNYFLKKIFIDMKLPISGNRFVNEKIYRFDKREASLVEWFVGVIYVFIKEDTPRSIPENMIQDILRDMLSNIFFKSVSTREQMEVELTYFEQYISEKH